MASGKFRNFCEQCSPPKLHCRRSFFGVPGVSWPSLMSRWRGKWFRRGFLELLRRAISTKTSSSSFFFFLCFHRRRCYHRSNKLASSPQRRCHLGKGRPSSVFSLRIQPANIGHRKLPRIRCPRLSSSRSATSPPRACHRGQSSPVSRCP